MGVSYLSQRDYREKGLLMAVRGAHSFLRRQIKILHSLQFSPGTELPNHGKQVNFCSVYLVGIKKEKDMFFNPKVEWQAQAKIDYNKASDIIGKADRKNV